MRDYGNRQKLIQNMLSQDLRNHLQSMPSLGRHLHEHGDVQDQGPLRAPLKLAVAAVGCRLLAQASAEVFQGLVWRLMGSYTGGG